MKNEIVARHYATGKSVRLSWRNGVITGLDQVDDSPPSLWLAPLLTDLQINGYAGIDFQQDNLSVDDLHHATRELQRAACGAYFVTLMTDHWPALMQRFRALVKLRATSPILRQAIAGWHLEGPFLSAEPGYCGAHEATAMLDPTPEHLTELRRITGTDPVLLTLAPERANAVSAIRQAVSLGIKVSLGHTNASAEVLTKAFEAGASAFTHLGNGCPALLDRSDNVLWRVLDLLASPGLPITVSLIPDRIHVAPSLFRLFHRLLGQHRLYYTTDAMAAAGAAPGQYSLGRLQLEVGEDQVVHLPGQPNFAGSALRPIDGVFRAAEMLDCPWQVAWARFSDVPAQLAGLPVGLAPGAAANFCMVDVPTSKRAKPQIFVGGEMM